MPSMRLRTNGAVLHYAVSARSHQGRDYLYRSCYPLTFAPKAQLSNEIHLGRCCIFAPRALLLQSTTSHSRHSYAIAPKAPLLCISLYAVSTLSHQTHIIYHRYMLSSHIRTSGTKVVLYLWCSYAPKAASLLLAFCAGAL